MRAVERDILRRIEARRTARVAGVVPATPGPAPVASVPLVQTRPPVASLPPLVAPTPSDDPIPVPDVLARLRARQTQKTTIPEGRRIRALPTWDESDLEGLDLTDEFRTATGTMRLRPRQSLALHFLRSLGRGLVGPLGVGSGKTLLTLLASVAVGARAPVLLIPPAMRVPLEREIAKLRPHWRIPTNLQVLSYSHLSVATGSELLESLRPDLVIADEAHMLRYPDSARTKRVLRYFRQYPTTKFVAVSGTLTAKSLRDYAHLCELALRDGSPMPREARDLIAWANCIDARGIARPQDWDVLGEWESFRHLDDAAERRIAARQRFEARLTSTPGVVSTREASVACSLVITRRVAPPLPTVVADALREMRKTWMRPDGEELVSPLDVWRLGVQMAQGFFYRWDWPAGKPDLEWMSARAAWHRAVREYLKLDLPGLDSPLLVTNGVIQGRIADPWMTEPWREWDRVRHRPKPPTVTVWLDTYLLDDADRWRKRHPKGIVWYSDHAIADALRDRGHRVFASGQTPPYDGEALALSTHAHGTGLNLQPWSENLILSWPSSGKACEQLLGRTHRAGQEADEVGVWWYGHTPEMRAAMAKSREEAKYIEQTTGSPQKLVYAAFVGSDDDEPPQGG